MSANKLALGLAGALAVGGVGLLLVQERANARVAREIAAEQVPAAELAALRRDHAALLRQWNEARAAATTVTLAAPSAAAAVMGEAVKALPARPVNRQATVIRRATPEYPEAFRTAGIGGQVVVDFVVDQQGRVRNAYAAQSDERELESFAVKGVAAQAFDPGARNGKAVNIHVQQIVTFDPRVGARIGGANWFPGKP